MPSLIPRRKMHPQVGAPPASPLPEELNSIPIPNPIDASAEASPRFSNPWGFPMAPPPSSPHLPRMELLIELPDVFVFPPEEDPVQEAHCVWDSKTEAVNVDMWDAASAITDNSKGPDWIGLSEALKYIRDAHADVPAFRRMSEEALESGSVIMPRKSTSSLSSGTSSSWSKCSIYTDPTTFGGSASANIPSISTPTKQNVFGAIRLAFRGSSGKVGQTSKPSPPPSYPTVVATSKRRRTPTSVPDVSKLGDLPSDTSVKPARRASSPLPEQLPRFEPENKDIFRRPGSPPPTRAFPVQAQTPPSPHKLAPSLPHSPSIECIPDLTAGRSSPASLPAITVSPVSPLQAQRPAGNAKKRTSTVLASKPSSPSTPTPAPSHSTFITTSIPAASLALPISAETMVSSVASTFEDSAVTSKPGTSRGISDMSELGVLKGTSGDNTSAAVDPPRRTSAPTLSLSTQAAPVATLAPSGRPRSLSGTFSKLFKRSSAPALTATPAPRSPKSSTFAKSSTPVKPSASAKLLTPSKTSTPATPLPQAVASLQSDSKPVTTLEPQAAPKRGMSLGAARSRSAVDLDTPVSAVKTLGPPPQVPNIASDISPLSVWRAEPVGLVKQGPPCLPEFSFSPVPVQEKHSALTAEFKAEEAAPVVVQEPPAAQDKDKDAPVRDPRHKTRGSSRSKRIVGPVPPLGDFTLPPMSFISFGEDFEPHLMRNMSTRQSVRHKRSGTVKLRNRQGKSSLRKASAPSRTPSSATRELPPLPPPPTGPVPAIPPQDATVVENAPSTLATDLLNPQPPVRPPAPNPQPLNVGKSTSPSKTLNPSMKTPPQIGVPVELGLGLGLGLAFNVIGEHPNGTKE